MNHPRVIVKAFVTALSLLVSAGCVSESKGAGGAFDQAADAAGRGGWGASAGGPEAPEEDVGPPERIMPANEPEDIVSIPEAVARPVLEYFDSEGFLLGDRIEIDCSYQPFLAQMVAQATSTYASGVQVERRDVRTDDLLTITLERKVDREHGVHNIAISPRATFATMKDLHRDERTATVEFRPPFEFAAAHVLIVRVHLRPTRERPVFFRAVATSSDQEGSRPSLFIRPASRRRAEGTTLVLQADLVRGEDGKWRGAVQEP
jgi:hypothetical protein